MAKDKRLTILKQANKLFRQGKIDAAIKEYNKVLELKPDDLEVRRIVGDLQLRQNNLPEAVKQFEWIADYYLKEGFFAKAIAMFKRVTRIDPNYEKASFKLAELYTKQGLVIEAKQIYLDLAEEYKRQQNQKKALDMYKKILEFDRSNTKMRLLLADNYLKENLIEDAVNEYVIASDILLNKREFDKAENLLKNTIAKVKEPKLIQKLVQCYNSQEKDDNAIDLLKNSGPVLLENIELMKTLGELYLKKNQTDDAEEMFSKVAEIDPNEADIILKLGKVYIQREDYDRTYELFLPVVDKHLQENKFEEAASLLRFIIASKFDHLPALQKLAAVYEKSGKSGNLIALLESLIPIYEKKGMQDALKENLEKLIKLSDTPFSYEEQLARLASEQAEQDVKTEEEEADTKLKKFIKHQVDTAEEALKISDYKKAIDVLKETKMKAPQTIAAREKLFDIYYKIDEVDMAIEEGKELLSIYQARGMEYEYSELLDKLSILNPEDEKLIEMSGEEKTSIDIDFGTGEFQEQIEEIKREQMHRPEPPQEKETADSEEDVLLLTDMDSIAPPAAQEEEKEKSKADSREDKRLQKSLSSLLSELDFYINDGYFGDAEQLIDQLKKKYSGDEGLMQRVNKLEHLRDGNKKPAEIPEMPEIMEIEDPDEAVEADSQDFSDLDDLSFNLESSDDHREITANLGTDDLIESKDKSEKFIEIHEAAYQDDDPISEESQIVRELEQSKSDSAFLLEEDPGEITSTVEPLPDDGAYEIEMEEPEDSGHIPIDKIDDELLSRSPTTTPEAEPSFSDDAFDVDSVIDGIPEADQEDSAPPPPPVDIPLPEEATGPDMDSPFIEIDQTEIPFEDDDELLRADELLIEDESYFEIETNVSGELESIAFWLKELEKQRTTTIEKNMIEIFDEFKKGIDEKIGQEDYDTRYNLGIAYKEMGLVEEAIHEFLISAKHPSKFFDSAGLLGMCFMEKGMLGEAVTWYEKALETPERKEQEYLAIKYELIMALKAKEDYEKTGKVIEDMMRTHPNYRNIAQIYREITSGSGDMRT